MIRDKQKPAKTPKLDLQPVTLATEDVEAVELVVRAYVGYSEFKATLDNLGKPCKKSEVLAKLEGWLSRSKPLLSKPDVLNQIPRKVGCTAVYLEPQNSRGEVQEGEWCRNSQ